jgi:hypothetical protein
MESRQNVSASHETCEEGNIAIAGNCFLNILLFDQDQASAE